MKTSSAALVANDYGASPGARRRYPAAAGLSEVPAKGAADASTYAEIASVIYAAACREASWQDVTDRMSDSLFGASVTLLRTDRRSATLNGHLASFESVIAHSRHLMRGSSGEGASREGGDVLELGWDAQPGNSYRIRASRRPDERSFCRAEQILFERVQPHFKRALALHSRIEAVERGWHVARFAINQSRLGVVILGACRAVIDLNEPARSILAEEDGLRIVGGAIEADSGSETTELRKLITEALSGAVPGRRGAALAVTRPSGRPKLHVLVCPISRTEPCVLANAPTVVLYLRAPDPTIHAEEALGNFLGLTTRERHVALHILNGMNRKETARRMRVSVNTVRTHLRTLLEKASARSQKDLVCAFFKSVIAMA